MTSYYWDIMVWDSVIQISIRSGSRLFFVVRDDKTSTIVSMTMTEGNKHYDVRENITFKRGLHVTATCDITMVFNRER